VQTGRTTVHGVFGPQETETYVVNIGLPHGVMFTGAIVTKGAILGADVLIGMDIISRGDFAVTNAGGFTKFSFRTPSIEHIDYYEQAIAIQKANAPAINRAERRRAKKGKR
jgi:hypothetical protein